MSYKNLKYIMAQSSGLYCESDEDHIHYIQTEMKVNPKLIAAVKSEYAQALKDPQWSWSKANQETQFIGHGALLKDEFVHTAFKEKIWSLISPGAS